MTRDPRIPISTANETPTDDESSEVEGHGRNSPRSPEEAGGETVPEVEGHITRYGGRMVEPPTDDDERDTDQAEVEGHLVRIKAMEIPAHDDRDSEQAEVEGHYMRFGKAVELPPNTDERDSEQADEVEGHVIRGHLMPSESDDEDASEDGDVENAIKPRG